MEEKDPETNEVVSLGVNIPTLEGVMRGSEGDYVIKGTHNEWYPCKPFVFELKYEED